MNDTVAKEELKTGKTKGVVIDYTEVREHVGGVI